MAAEKIYIICEREKNIKMLWLFTFSSFGGWRFSCCPIGPYRPRSQPLSVHGRDSAFRFLCFETKEAKALEHYTITA